MLRAVAMWASVFLKIFVMRPLTLKTGNFAEVVLPYVSSIRFHTVRDIVTAGL